MNCYSSLYPFQIAYPPVQQRPAFTQPLTLLTETLGYTQNTNAFAAPQPTAYNTLTQTSQAQYNASLPYLATGTATITIPSTVWTPSNERGSSMPRPPPSLRARPLSAGSTRRVGSTYDRVQTVGGSPVNSPVMQRSMCIGIQSSCKLSDLFGFSVKKLFGPTGLHSTFHCLVR